MRYWYSSYTQAGKKNFIIAYCKQNLLFFLYDTLSNPLLQLWICLFGEHCCLAIVNKHRQFDNIL